MSQFVLKLTLPIPELSQTYYSLLVYAKCLGEIKRTTNIKCHREIERRTVMGKEAFSKRGELLRGKLDRNVKKRIIRTLIWNVMQYGSGQGPCEKKM